MSKPVIKVQNLSKRYRLGLKEKQAETLAGQISQVIRSPWENLKKLRKLSRFDQEDESVFWALKDVSFEVKEGEVLGIIGKNGAGKSTLLKILSQITEPTSGKIEIHGRVASLLEVGTGFHPELSGRENIYMNGTILGMTRREIDSKLEEIIDFSGIEKFIDTPVKFYSSGMKVRLGFSVAAHLDPEILIIDEVLAVGDYEFQKKCLGKMEDVSKNQGRTVLFVSHSMSAVQTLCSSTIMLENGKIVVTGPTDKIIKRYLGAGSPDNFFELKNGDVLGEGSRKISLKSVFFSSDLNQQVPVCSGLDLFITLNLELNENIFNRGERVDLRIDNQLGQRLLWLSTKVENQLDLRSGKLVFKVPNCPLVPDEYVLTVYIHDGIEVSHWLPAVTTFKVENSKYFSNGLQIPPGQTNIIYPFEIIQ
ncbi:ABC transporter ATP-binding protein [Algoriphagus kandeliae]|uniref:ABC transporter ATP-binding protein n=1 Tax=Algoriphagus kandeliae TaxID=2562278 RepID=A0A4Y9R1N6_9BACT|nr:ABC transporter ATP-binding protein [Algoriphagus kandeliae]TFV97256.1 ABC transporter ATP-binding protein [Algoriphagus kandeliae]